MEHTDRKQAERMQSILKNWSFHFDLAVFRTTFKKLRDCEYVLNRGAEKFFKEGVLELYGVKVEEDCDNVEIVMNGINAADLLREQVLLATADDCVFFCPSVKE